MDAPLPTTPTDVMNTLVAAINRHDLDELVAQFAEDVRSETPAHPARNFVGREQVHRNWSQILGAVADLRVDVLTIVADGALVTAELAFDGHRPDGAPWQMRGVTVNEVVDGRIAAVRFYMEPIDAEAADALDADAAVRRALAPAGAPR